MINMFIAYNCNASSKPCLTRTDALINLLLRSVKVTDTDVIVKLSTNNSDGILVSYPRRFSKSGTSTTDTLHNIVHERAKDFNVVIKNV